LTKNSDSTPACCGAVIVTVTRRSLQVVTHLGVRADSLSQRQMGL